MASPRFEPIAAALAPRISARALISAQDASAVVAPAPEEPAEGTWERLRSQYALVVQAAEKLLGAPQFDRLSQLLDELQDEFEPKGPPHSPVYPSELSHIVLGQTPEGLAGETPLSVVARLVSMSAERQFLAPLAQALAEQVPCLFQVDEVAEQVAQGRVLPTMEARSVRVHAPWLAEGGLYLARTVLFESHFYLLQPPYRLEATVSQWLDYLERVRRSAEQDAGGEPQSPSRSRAKLSRKQKKKRQSVRKPDPLGRHLRGGTEPRFWLRYILAAFAGQSQGIVSLRGVPDRQSTLPHGDLLP